MARLTSAPLGIIGGSGLYSLEGLQQVRRKAVSTPFGKPSAPLVFGRLNDVDLVFLPRHGEKHQFLPSEVNYRANIWALKSVGVRKVLSISAVGSLQMELAPGDLAVADQYLDFTKGIRAHTFLGKGIVAHVSTAEPVCGTLVGAIRKVASKTKLKIHFDKTYVCVEGPRFGTRAESHFFRQANCHIIGMTNVTEAFLAREAQLCYSTLAVVTDYDCWLEDPTMHASLDKLLALYKETLVQVKEWLPNLFDEIKNKSAGSCACRQSFQGAMLTPDSALSPAAKKIVKMLRS